MRNVVRLSFYLIAFEENNFSGVPIVIIKKETKEVCQCPCKQNADAYCHTEEDGKASLVVLDSTSVSPARACSPLVQQQIELSPSSAQMTASPSHSAYVPPVVNPQKQVMTPGFDLSTLGLPSSSGACVTYDYDMTSASAPVFLENSMPTSISDDIPTNFSCGNVNIGTLLTSIDSQDSPGCCDNTSSLQCVTLGCSNKNDPLGQQACQTSIAQ